VSKKSKTMDTQMLAIKKEKEKEEEKKKEKIAHAL
jgi:hypothetical protein